MVIVLLTPGQGQSPPPQPNFLLERGHSSSAAYQLGTCGERGRGEHIELNEATTCTYAPKFLKPVTPSFTLFLPTVATNSMMVQRHTSHF